MSCTTLFNHLLYKDVIKCESHIKGSTFLYVMQIKLYDVKSNSLNVCDNKDVFSLHKTQIFF